MVLTQLRGMRGRGTLYAMRRASGTSHGDGCMSDLFVEGQGTLGALPPDDEVVFEGTEPFAVRRRRSPLLRTALILLPIVLAVIIIFASQSGGPAALLAAARRQPAAFTVPSDVPSGNLRRADPRQPLALPPHNEHP